MEIVLKLPCSIAYKTYIMKTKLLLITIFTALAFNFALAQNIVPNGDFSNGTNGWSITGNNLSLTTFGYTINDNLLEINNSTTTDETFTLTSSLFSLLPNEVYKINIEYGYYEHSIEYPSGADLYTPISYLTNVVLKDFSGTVVGTYNLTGNNTLNSNYGNMAATSGYLSNQFSAPVSGMYYIELTGVVGQTDMYDFHYAFDYIKIIKENLPNVIEGTVSYDINSDNCASSTYTPSNVLIKSTASTSGNTYYANTNSNGDFILAFDETGTVATEVVTNNLIASPTSYSNTFSGPQTVSNQDFCVTSSISGHDVGIVIVPTSDARPGFDSSYNLIYTNDGDTTVSGTLNLSYNNTKVNYLSAIPAENSTTNTSSSWNYTNLQPFETRIINVNFSINTPPTVNNGENLPFTVTINPTVGDGNSLNNSFVLNQTTIGSYDPNDAVILEGPFIIQTQVNNDLHFRLRFQNTGTASAININVTTLLDSDLDWSTFQPESASHAYTTSVNNTTGEVNFQFTNINLADSTTDEPNSHGWVLFKAKPISTFAVGDIIETSADIYFDYNTPITTNTATTQIKTQTYVPDDEFEQRLINLGYDSGALDDYVPTANIIGVTSLNVSGGWIIDDLTGIEDFAALEILYVFDSSLNQLNITQNNALRILGCGASTLTTLDTSQNLQLTYLNCFGSFITNLDVSNNVNLTYLNCYYNSITTLDISNNLLLETLHCGSNLITNLDVSQNANLITLTCGDLPITTIDVSQNSMLSILKCNYSPQLVSLDLSINSSLTEIECYGNSALTSLTVKNGNNTVITNFKSYANPNLSCIEVDNASYSTTNWTDIDATTSFSENCATMSINEECISQIKLYPNPAIDYLHIKRNNITNLDYQIMDTLGKAIGSGTMVSNKINISLLKSGIYFLRLSDEKIRHTSKFIKQ